MSILKVKYFIAALISSLQLDNIKYLKNGI